MKSIKEKAEEYDRVVERINANESIVDVSGREQFVAGANYVLGEIENVLNNPYQCTFKTLKANIEELVIKLKEK